MNKATRELLDRKKEENRLKEEKKLLKQNKEEQKLLNKNIKNDNSLKNKKIEKKIITKIAPVKVKKEKIINDDDEKIIQDNYNELKKQSEKTELFIKFADNLNVDDKDVPRTEKGMNTKAKELLDRLKRKIEKEEKKK